MTQPGEASVDKIEVTDSGAVRLKIVGRDTQRGRWVTTFAHVPWSVWIRLTETAYNEREEIAQARIC